MTTTTSDFDPFTEEAILDAHRHDGAEVRERAPAVHLERYDIWAIGRHEHVLRSMREPGTFSNTSRPFFDPHAIRPRLLVGQDPPEHTGPRAVIQRALGPVSMKRLREHFEAAAEEHVERLLAGGDAEVDGHLDVTAGFVLRAFPDAIGLPEEGRHHLLRFGDAAFNAFGPDNEIRRRGMELAVDALAWVGANTKRAALTPGGLGEQMYEAADRGEVSEEDAEALVLTMFAAGFDTTISGLDSLLINLARRPDVWAAAREDPALLRSAFEETVRFESPSRFGGRVLLEDVELDGVNVPAGAKIMVMFLAAGRDPRRWEDPDTWDPRRKVTGHINLGHGIHACAGQSLARLEAASLFGALARRVASIELTAQPQRAVNFQAHGYDHVPVALTAA
jgi:cytochrome P450